MSNKSEADRNISPGSDDKETKPIICTGKIVDYQGKSVSGAKVSLYKIMKQVDILALDMELSQVITTGKEGIFRFEDYIKNDQMNRIVILAEKKGLAIGWAYWRLYENNEIEIILHRPKLLSGIVVDENSIPVVGAKVSIPLIKIRNAQRQDHVLENPSEKFLFVKTDTEGKFSFHNIPEDATVEFLVEKEGRASVSTLRPQCGSITLQFSSGQADIRLIQPKEAIIEGTAMEKETGKAISGIKIRALGAYNIPNFALKPVVTKKNGKFRFNHLAPDKYSLQLSSLKKGIADWVAEPVKVKIKAGETKRDIRIELCKGGLLEISITDDKNSESIPEAGVILRKEKIRQIYFCCSDKNGIARIRLMPGEYRIYTVQKEGYTNIRPSGVIKIDDGLIIQTQHQIERDHKITGVVKDDKGNLIKNAVVTVCPMKWRRDTTDAHGRFEVWGPWSKDQRSVMLLFVQYEKENLAAAVEIIDDTQKMDVRLKTGATLAGKVADPDGKGIPNARITTLLSEFLCCSPIEPDISSDAEGNFEIKALPAGYNYEIRIYADGYGDKSVKEIETKNIQNNTFDLGTIKLVKADFSVSGILVDTNDKPLADAEVFSFGENQPHYNTQTDAQGRFTLEKVCAGKIEITAITRYNLDLAGVIETERGASNIKVVMRGRPTVSFSHCTDRLRKVILLGNQKARELNCEYLGTEHILHGLIEEGGGVGVAVLKNLNVDMKKLRLEIKKCFEKRPDMLIVCGKSPQTPRAKKVLEYAAEEAGKMNHNYVGTEHILIALLRERDGMAARILMSLNLKPENVRQEIINIEGHD